MGALPNPYEIIMVKEKKAPSSVFITELGAGYKFFHSMMRIFIGLKLMVPTGNSKV